MRYEDKLVWKFNFFIIILKIQLQGPFFCFLDHFLTIYKCKLAN